MRRHHLEQISLVGMTVGLTALAACGGSEEMNPEPGQTILGVVSDRPELSRLASLIETAGIEGELSDPDARLMLFAPTDLALDALPAELVTFLEDNPDVLADVLKYHVALERRSLGGLNPIDDESIPTAEGEAITVVGAPPRVIEIQDATGRSFSIVRGDISAGLSVIHVIDGVMLPRTIEIGPGPGDIVDVAMESARFGVLLDAASELEVNGRTIASILRDPEAQTLFAPTDAAFGDLGVEGLSTVENDTDLGDVVTNLLMAHLAPGEFSAAELAEEGEIATRARLSFGFVPADEAGPATIGGAAVDETDIEASNGRIHALDEVILPPTVLGVATSTPGLGFLADIVNEQASPQTLEAMMPDPLGRNDRPITVFAPDDMAFAEADLTDEDVDRVLAHHVIEGQLTFDDLVATPDGTELETLDGDLLTVLNDGSTIMLRDARNNEVELLAVDVRGRNGVVHIIDRVLLPPQPPGRDVVQTLAELSEDPGNGFELGTLQLAASSVEIGDVAIATILAGPGSFTVFAPTDAAFDALGVDLTDLDTDADLRAVVTNILLTHAAEGRLAADDLAMTGGVDTLANTTIPFDASVSPPEVSGAAVRITDVTASNGVVHVLDEVIIPSTILDISADTSTLSELNTAVQGASASVQAALAPNVLSGDRPVTVFAPSDVAFEAADLGDESLDGVLAFHVVPGQVTAEQLRALTDGTTLTTVQGGLLTVRTAESVIELEDARGNIVSVLDPDIRGFDGVIHGINSVLLPPESP